MAEEKKVDEAWKEKARREQKQPVLIFVFLLPEGQENFAAQTEFSDALKLARLLTSARLSGLSAGTTTGRTSSPSPTSSSAVARQPRGHRRAGRRIAAPA